jgi:hypothetical protein
MGISTVAEINPLYSGGGSRVVDRASQDDLAADRSEPLTAPDYPNDRSYYVRYTTPLPDRPMDAHEDAVEPPADEPEYACIGCEEVQPRDAVAPDNAQTELSSGCSADCVPEGGVADVADPLI